MRSRRAAVRDAVALWIPLGLLLTIGPARAHAQQGLPEIPLDSFPDVSRAAIAPALEEARAHPADPARVGRLAMTLHAWEQYDTAAAVYARARDLDRRFDWFYLGGLVETRRAHHEEAARLLGQAVERAPDAVPARLAWADALLAAGETDAALAEYSRLTEGAGAPHAHYGIGRALAARGDAAGALRALEKAVTLYPEFGAAWYARGMALRNAGKLDEAKAALAKAEQFGARWPAVDDPLMARVRAIRADPSAHADRGLQLERQGDISGAIAEYEAAATADPAHVAARVNLIALYGRQKEWGKAAAHYEAVTASGGSVPAEAHLNYALCLAGQGKLDAAAELLQKALAVNPQYASAWTNLGRIAEMGGRIEEAEADYRRAADLAPADADARFNLSRMLIARRQYGQAITELQLLAGRDLPERARYLFALGTAHVLSGDVPAGRRYATEARDLARERGQVELADAIERELRKLPE